MTVDTRRQLSLHYKIMQVFEKARKAVTDQTGCEAVVKTLYIDQRSYMRLIREMSIGSVKKFHRVQSGDMDALEACTLWGAELLVVLRPTGIPQEHIFAVAVPVVVPASV